MAIGQCDARFTPESGHWWAAQTDFLAAASKMYFSVQKNSLVQPDIDFPALPQSPTSPATIKMNWLGPRVPNYFIFCGAMSAVHPKADTAGCPGDVRDVPEADICHDANRTLGFPNSECRQ
jgi:hypothetical protein